MEPLDSSLSVRQVANFAKVSRQAVFKAIWRGELVAVKVGSYYVVSAPNARKFKRAHDKRMEKRS